MLEQTAIFSSCQITPRHLEFASSIHTQSDWRTPKQGWSRPTVFVSLFNSSLQPSIEDCRNPCMQWKSHEKSMNDQLLCLQNTEFSEGGGAGYAEIFGGLRLTIGKCKRFYLTVELSGGWSFLWDTGCWGCFKESVFFDFLDRLRKQILRYQI